MTRFPWCFSFSIAAVLALLPGCGGVIDGDDDDDEVVPDLPPVKVCAGVADAAFATLGEAVAASPTGAVLEVCAGTYAERLALDGKRVTLRGAGAGLTILDAGGAGTAMTVSGGAELVVAGFTVQHGDAGEAAGGAIRCEHAGVSITDSALIDNRAFAGGALYGDTCELAIARTLVAGNQSRPRGGGLYLIASTGEVVDSRFTGNTADEGGALAILEGAVAVRGNQLDGNHGRSRGGAIYLAADGPIEHNQLTGNDAGWTGGALYVWEHAPAITGNTLDGNDAVEEGGGAYFHMSQAVITDNTITGNTALDDGGGVRLFTSRARLERNHIAGNQAGGDGGGVKISHLPSQLIDNVIADNVAGGVGGGLELDNDASVVRGGVVSGNRAGGGGGGIHLALWPWNGGVIDGVRLAGNHAHRGGAIDLDENYQPVALRRLVIEDNEANHGGGIHARSTAFTLANSLVRGNDGGNDGGGVYLRAPRPWTDPCPCPPATPAMTIDFVVFHANRADTGTALWIEAPNLSVESSILQDHAGAAVVVAGPNAVQWRYNDAVPASFAGMADPTGASGNLSVAPLFTDPAGGDFRLQATSRCVDAGDPAMRDRDGSRADMGLFAGPESP